MTDIVIKRGWDIGQSTRIATLYDEAFGFKFSGAIANKEVRVRILSKSFIPDFSYVAFVDHEIVGLAGFQAHYGSFTGGMSLSVLIDELGVASGIWAATVLSLFERKPKAQELIMDGIVVDSKFRGKGIGSMLLDSIVSHAGKNGYDSVRLDVIVVRPDFSRQFLGFENTLLQRLLVSTCHCVCDAVLDYKTFQYNGILS
uniref:GNAT family N-acetyltransferase n=2 Tax=Zooshikella ganghwensis TaxID=202772 RepID=UPI001BB09C86